MIKMKRLLLLFLLALVPLCGSSLDDEDQQLTIQNRILARIGDKTISVLDVMKKMEVYLARNYPDLAHSPGARFQFFSTNWRQIFSQMVDNELMLADAEQVQLKISDAEVRETLHERFGPNIMPKLDALGISYDEAWQMIYSEMAVQRMSYFRVQSKALQRIGPNDIKAAYKKYLQEHPATQQWKYQLLSIRGPSEAVGSELAKKAYALLSDQKLPLAEAVDTLKKTSDASITLSEEYDISGKDLSEAHKKVLLSLKPGSFSAPTTQVSRADQSIVHRIFFLKDRKEITPPPFEEMTENLHDELVQKEIDKELPKYLNRLRQRFNVDEKSIETLPRDFQPFQLR